MKKLGIAFAVTLLLILIGGGVYFVLTMEEEAPLPATSASEAQTQPELNVRRQAKNYAEMLDSLDYEILQNRDTVAWLKVPGTEINNSVVQSYDNAYYLRRNERRQYDVYGCYFLDYECMIGSREDLSRNTIVYGHEDVSDDPNSKRFSQLYKFLDPAFARATPTIQFCTQQDPMDWQVFAVFYTNISFNYIAVDVDDEEFAEIITTARQKSIYDYDVEVGVEDKILTLSTCTVKYGDHEHRFVVMAKLTRKRICRSLPNLPSGTRTGDKSPQNRPRGGKAPPLKAGPLRAGADTIIRNKGEKANAVE